MRQWQTDFWSLCHMNICMHPAASTAQHVIHAAALTQNAGTASSIRFVDNKSATLIAMPHLWRLKCQAYVFFVVLGYMSDHIIIMWHKS